MIVASLEARYSTLRDNIFICFMRVICTPQGIGQPINLCPETLTLPMGFLKDTFGACPQEQKCVEMNFFLIYHLPKKLKTSSVTLFTTKKSLSNLQNLQI
jgi:hypothetical protein